MSIAPSSRSSMWASTRVKRLRPALLALALLAALVLPGRAAIVEEIVVKVNNRIISKSEFEERSAYILRQIYQQAAGSELDEKLEDARQTMLANMITELLLIERAQSLLDLDKVRKNLVDDFRKQQNIANDDELEKLLKEQNMSRKDLEEQLIRLAVPGEVINYEVRRKISVSDAEIKAYYDAHRKDYESAPTVTFNEIVLFYEDASKPEVEARARGVVREARGGTDFSELVQKYSEAPSKETGGFLGPLGSGDLSPAIADAAFSLKINDVSDPIDTGRSYHVIRLVGKTDASVKTIDEEREAIMHAVREAKFKPRYDHYIKKLWHESQIEVLPKYEQYLVWSPLKQPPAAEAKLPAGSPGAQDPGAPPSEPAPTATPPPAPEAKPTPTPPTPPPTPPLP